MYWNELAWKAPQENFYVIDEAMKEFLRIYAELNVKFRVSGLYVPEESDYNLLLYPIEKWMHDADPDDCRRFLQFWQRRKEYKPEDECEFRYQGKTLHAASEAILNDGFVVSIGLNEEWKQERIAGRFYTLTADVEEDTEIINLYHVSQIYKNGIAEILQEQNKIRVNSYQELWEKRGEYFPHLSFCPSVEKKLRNLQMFYIDQVIRKLSELELYCEKQYKGPFDAGKLSKTTQETEATLKRYRKEHTFSDEKGKQHLASWHMRFTGIPGRIFFIPDYEKDRMLVCHIGEKLPTVNYPT